MDFVPRAFVSGLAVALCLLFISGIAAGTDEEALGQAAEQAGKLREALTHYVAALQSAPEGSTADQRLRETIIRLVHKLDPPPAIPEGARRFSIRGRTALEEAKGTAGFAEAVKEFSKALRLAPWWAESYFNLGLALEKAGELDGAIRNLKLYLVAAPNASDVEKVKEHIYAIEYRKERAQKETIAKREAEEQERRRREEAGRREKEEERRRAEEARRQEQELLSLLNGRWRDSCTGESDEYNVGNPIELRMLGDVLERRYWDAGKRQFAAWFAHGRYDPNTRSFLDQTVRGNPITRRFRIRSPDVIEEESLYPTGSSRCELRRLR